MAPMLPRPAVPLDPEYEGSDGARRKQLKEEMLEELVAASTRRARAAEEWRARVEFHQERCADLVSRGITHARRAARRQERKISAAMREAAAAAREVMELLRENLDFEREMQRSMLGLLSRQTACIEAALQRPFPGACHGAGEPPRHTMVP